MNYISYDEIVPVKVQKDEQETTISFYRNENTCSLYTSDNTMITKMSKRLKLNPKEYKCYICSFNSNHEPTGYIFIFPKKYLSFRGQGRILTDEQKQKLSERMKKVQERKNIES